MVSGWIDSPLSVVPGTAWISRTDADHIIFSLGFTEDEEGLSRVAGSSIFTFQKVKRGHSMAQTGESIY